MGNPELAALNLIDELHEYLKRSVRHHGEAIIYHERINCYLTDPSVSSEIKTLLSRYRDVLSR